jgi:hypothetical protein
MRAFGTDLALADRHLRPRPLGRIDEAVLEEVQHGIGARHIVALRLRGSTSCTPNSSSRVRRRISCAT